MHIRKNHVKRPSGSRSALLCKNNSAKGKKTDRQPLQWYRLEEERFFFRMSEWVNPVLLRSTAISINRIMFLCESALRILISRREVIGNFFFVKSENTSLATDRPPAKAKKNKKPPHKKNLIANHPTQRQHMRKRAGVITVGEQKAERSEGKKETHPILLSIMHQNLLQGNQSVGRFMSSLMYFPRRRAPPLLLSLNSPPPNPTQSIRPPVYSPAPSFPLQAMRNKHTRKFPHQVSPVCRKP